MSGTWDLHWNRLTQIDVAVTNVAVVAAYDVDFDFDSPNPPRVHLVRINSAGTIGTERVIDNGRQSMSPTLGSTGDSLLAVWSEIVEGRWRLRHAVIDPALRSAIIGEPLIDEAGSQTAPWLIAGDGQFLCLWLIDGEIHAVRIDAEGRVIDGTPLVLATNRPDTSPAQGVWTGVNYVVAWQQAGHVRANRVTARGRVADGLGFDVAVSRASPGALASLPDGKVAIPYGDRIRFLMDEAVPVAPVSLAVQASSQGVQLQWEVSGDFGGASSRLARRALRSPDELAPPPEGYARIAADMDFGGAGSHRYLDSDVEAGQWYAYAIALPMEDGSLVWSAPSIVQTEALMPALALHAPVPNPVRGVATFRLSLPTAAANARLELFDPAGRRVRRIALDRLEPGSHEIAWDGLDDLGREAAAGWFFARLTIGGESRTARFVRIR